MKKMNKKALHKITYGLYIVCSKYKEKANGQIANSIFQVTSKPPTIAISINKKNLTHELIDKSKKYTISVLEKETPLKFIGPFGFKCGRDTDKLTSVNCKLGKNGIPIVTDNTVAYIEASLINKIDVYTHTIFVGEVTDAEVISENPPLTYDYYHQVKGGLTSKNAPTYNVEKENEKNKKNLEEKNMDKYVCTVCGYVYDPEKGDPDGGIKPGTPFEEIPDDWVCPVCGAAKEAFEKQ